MSSEIYHSGVWLFNNIWDVCYRESDKYIEPDIKIEREVFLAKCLSEFGDERGAELRDRERTGAIGHAMEHISMMEDELEDLRKALALLRRPVPEVMKHLKKFATPDT
ncbi:hypothetical protein [Methylobacterium sp. CM6246]